MKRPLGIRRAFLMLGLGLSILGAPAWARATEGESYAYDPAGKRDPFRPLSLVRNSNPINQEPKTPLERYELGQLRLVGIVQQLDPPRAMVEDSAGLGFILRPGTPIGPSGGVVSEIRSREVVIEEWETDLIGRRHRTERVLELPDDGEATAP